MKDYYNSEAMKTSNGNMEHARTSKMANGLVKFVTSLYQVCIKSALAMCQVCVKSVLTRNQLPTKAVLTPYQGRINSLFTYNLFRRLAVAFALVVMMTVSDSAWGQRALPYSYNFDDNDLAASGWTTYSVGTVNTFGIFNQYYRSEYYCFRFNSYSTDNNGYDQYLFSPQLDGRNGVVMTFWYRSYSSGTEKFKVGYSTTDTDPQSFIWGNEISTSSTTYVQSDEYSFPVGTKYIAIHYYSNYQYYLYVDDFNFSVPPSCPKPTNLTISDISSTSATVSWTAGGSETNWIIEYSTSSDFPAGSTTIVNVNTNPTCNISGLTPETVYYVRVKADCGGGDQSTYSNVGEFTASDCRIIGTGTSSSNLVVSNYGSTYSQQIYTAQELTDEGLSAGNIVSVSFQYYAGGTNGYDETQTIFIGNSPITEFPAGNVGNFIGGLTQVYGPTSLSYQTGWREYVFSQPFEWDGTSDIIVGVLTNNSDRNYTYWYAYGTPGSAYRNIYRRGDYTTININNLNSTTSGGSRSTTRPNIKFCIEPTCPRKIHNREDWNDFCDCVNDGTEDYHNKTVTLAANVSNITRMAGTSDTRSFKGTFLGNGHTLNVEISGTGRAQAPFHFINGATIQDLVVTGSVTNTNNGYHNAGLVGETYGTNLIKNCHVSTTVSSGNLIGGIIGHCNTATNTVEGCVYDGYLNITGSGSTNYDFAGGLLGWSDAGATLTVINSLFNGTVSTYAKFHPVGCKPGNQSSPTFTSLNNCYYTKDPSGGINNVSVITNDSDKSGKHAYTVTGNGCVTVGLEALDTYYDVSGIAAYSSHGIRYVGVGGAIYGGDGESLSLILGCSNGGVESYSADHGTLSGSELDGANDPYILTMIADNTVISAVESSCPITEITSVTDWNKFCTCVSTGSDYSGLTVNLRADISVNTMAGNLDHPFRGTFDGLEHTITVNYTATNNDGTAPFQTIDGATFQNLHVTGTISMGDHSFGAGLAAKCYGNVTITNCKSSVTISSTHSGDGSNGGFISVNYGQYQNGSVRTVTFNGCVFSGSLLGPNTTKNGGFVGYTKYETDGSGQHWALVVLNNCLFAPTEVTMSNVNSATFSRYNTANHSNRVTTNNSYYTQPFTTAAFAANETDGTGPQGKQAYTVRGIEGVTAVRTGTPTDYSVSGISAYTTGLVYNGTIYGGNGDNLSLSLSYGGVAHDGYVADHGTLSGTETDGTNDPYTLTMIADSTKIKVACPNSITNRAKWNAFCNCVNNGHDYYNETVTLDANLTGGQTVSTMAGLSESGKPFKGTFEGNENTINVNINNSTGSPTNDDAKKGAAPFRYIDGATIRNLTVTGSVTSSAHHAAGLVGYCKDGGTNTIRNCHVSTNVTNNNAYDGDDGHNYVGGIIGHNLSATTSIIGCVYDGTITSQGFKGGMVGFGNYDSRVTITDSYFNGAYSTSGYATPNFSPIACHGSGRNFIFTFSNFYYNTDAGTFTAPAYEGTANSTYTTAGRAKHAYTVTGVDGVTVDRNNATATYNVSGITAYGTGIKYNSVFYGGDGDVLALLLSYSGDFCQYVADYGTLSGSATTGTNDSYSLTMVAENSHISVIQCEPVGLEWCDDFETDKGWRLINGTLTNQWVRGEAINNGGTHSIYISNDGGTSNAYTTSSAEAMVYAAKPFTFEDGLYKFSYDWKAYGESTWDYLRVALVPAPATFTAGTTAPSGFSTTGLPSGWIALDGGGKLNLQAEWQTIDKTINVTAGNYYLVFAWRNDGSYGSQTPAAIDNVCIKHITCPEPSAVTISSNTTSSAEISWTENGSATSWTIEYSTNSDFSNSTSVTVSDNPHTLTGLTSGATYYIRIKAVCGVGDESDWTPEAEFFVEDGCTTIGTAASRNKRVPFYSDNTSYRSYVQMLYKASEISDAGGCRGMITDIKFHYDASEYNQGLKIYLGSTSQTSLATAWITDADLTLAYNGTVSFKHGWDTIHLQTPYYWDGESNILVAVLTTNPVTESERIFYSTSTTGGTRGIYTTGEIIIDATNIPSVAGNQYDQRADIKFCIDCCEPRTGESGFEFCRDNLNLAIGGSAAITMPVEGADGVTPSGTVHYSSNNTGVATVDDNGTVTGVAAGTAIITARIDYNDHYCPVVAKYLVKVGTAGMSSLTTCEGFESGTLNGWTSSGDYTWIAWQGYNSGSPGAPEGSYNAYVSASSYNNTSYLTSPVMDLSSAVSATLSFMYINKSWSGDIDELYTYYRTNSSDTWHEIFHTNTNHESWSDDQSQDINLTNLSSTYQIQFKVYGHWGHGVGLDDICISSENLFTPDEMPTVNVSNASQPNVCWNTDIAEMEVTASDDVTFEPALNTLDLSYNTSTHKITGTPNFTGTRTVIVTVTSDDGCLKAEKELTITVNQLEATISIEP